MFGPDYAPVILATNKRARKAAGGDPRARRPITGQRLAAVSGHPGGPDAYRTKSRTQAEPKVIMGPLVKESGLPAEPSAPQLWTSPCSGSAKGFSAAEGRVR